MKTQLDMDKIASESLVERLIDWGVDTVFGLPGDGINGIMEGLRRNADRVRFILVHHEESAALMATGYAKATGRIGVCQTNGRLATKPANNGYAAVAKDHQRIMRVTHDSGQLSFQDFIQQRDNGILIEFLF